MQRKVNFLPLVSVPYTFSYVWSPVWAPHCQKPKTLVREKDWHTFPLREITAVLQNPLLSCSQDILLDVLQRKPINFKSLGQSELLTFAIAWTARTGRIFCTKSN